MAQYLPYTGGDPYAAQNESLRRYNADMGRRREAGWGFEDTMRENELADAVQARAFRAQDQALKERQFAEGGRRFDVRMNALAQLLGAKPDVDYSTPNGGRPGMSWSRSGVHTGIGPERRPEDRLPYREATMPDQPYRFGGGWRERDGMSAEDMGLGGDLRNYLSRYLK